MLRPTFLKLSVFAFAALLASACGSSGSGAALLAPSTNTGTSTNTLVTPTTLLVTSQRVNTTNNEIAMSWAGSSPTYQLVIGNSPGTSNVATIDVTGSTYTWTSPRTGGTYYARVSAKNSSGQGAFSDELSMYVVDVRDMVDAMFFHGGVLSDSPGTATTNPSAGVWADGTRLRVLVSTQAGETSRANAQTFADQYAALFGGLVTATTEMTTDAMQDVGSSVVYPTPLAAFSIGVRVQSGICGSGALACANYGPSPLGSNKSIVTLVEGGGLNVAATAHEMGHAYGIGHVQTPIAGRPELRFMMRTSLASEQLTDAEKTAITFARAGGIRAGMTRNQALAAGLVNVFTSSATAAGFRSFDIIKRDGDK